MPQHIQPDIPQRGLHRSYLAMIYESCIDNPRESYTESDFNKVKMTFGEGIFKNSCLLTYVCSLQLKYLGVFCINLLLFTANSG